MRNPYMLIATLIYVATSGYLKYYALNHNVSWLGIICILAYEILYGCALLIYYYSCVPNFKRFNFKEGC
jgi:hypothetical protein